MNMATCYRLLGDSVDAQQMKRPLRKPAGRAHYDLG